MSNTQYKHFGHNPETLNFLPGLEYQNLFYLVNVQQFPTLVHRLPLAYILTCHLFCHNSATRSEGWIDKFNSVCLPVFSLILNSDLNLQFGET